MRPPTQVSLGGDTDARSPNALRASLLQVGKRVARRWVQLGSPTRRQALRSESPGWSCRDAMSPSRRSSASSFIGSAPSTSRPPGRQRSSSTACSYARALSAALRLRPSATASKDRSQCHSNLKLFTQFRTRFSASGSHP
jgi:hypothetical protein